MAAASGELPRALALYEWNTAMAGAAFGLLEAVEITVRNAFNDALVTKYGPGWWRPDQPPQILRGASLDDARRAIHRFEKPGVPLDTGKFVSETSFGFWARLVTKPYDDQWRGALHDAFAERAPSRQDTQHRLHRLKLLRNRIAHHEIIWSRDLARDQEAATWLLRQVNPSLLDWASVRLARFGQELTRRPAWAPPGTR